MTPTTLFVWLVPYSNETTISYPMWSAPRRPLLEYLPLLGRGTAIHLRIGHPYISPADVRPSNGFASLAYNKDTAVVVPAVAAVGRTPSSESCIMYSLTACACYSSSGGLHASDQMTLMEVSQRTLDSLYIRNIWLLYIVMFFCKPDMVSVSILVE